MSTAVLEQIPESTLGLDQMSLYHFLDFSKHSMLFVVEIVQLGTLGAWTKQPFVARFSPGHRRLGLALVDCGDLGLSHLG